MDELIDTNLKVCESFMFYPENLKEISKKFKNIDNADTNKVYQKRQGNNANANANAKAKDKDSLQISHVSSEHDIFIPYQKDKLFWCFYIILFGMEQYERDISHSFSVEKKLKIETIEKMKQSPLCDKMKELKIKRIDLENELLSNNEISLKCLYALCAVHSISLIIIAGKRYYSFDFGSNSSVEKNVICRQSSGEFAVYNGPTCILDSLYLVENVNKPIKSLASYLTSDLKELCTKMNIPLENSNGKQKPKNKLYEDVLFFMNS